MGVVQGRYAVTFAVGLRVFERHGQDALPVALERLVVNSTRGAEPVRDPHFFRIAGEWRPRAWMPETFIPVSVSA